MQRFHAVLITMLMGLIGSVIMGGLTAWSDGFSSEAISWWFAGILMMLVISALIGLVVPLAWWGLGK